MEKTDLLPDGGPITDICYLCIYNSLTKQAENTLYFVLSGVRAMGALLLIPFFLIRFGLLSLLDKSAIRRAAYFAPLTNREKPAYLIYQISNMAILVALFFLRIQTAPLALFSVGAAMFLSGSIVLTVSIVNFAAPSDSGMNRSGLYRLSRNPMYVAYFLYFMGCALLTQSLLLFVFVLVFQISGHWIILAEERWCIQNFGEEYIAYMKRVRRYF